MKQNIQHAQPGRFRRGLRLLPQDMVRRVSGLVSGLRLGVRAPFGAPPDSAGGQLLEARGAPQPRAAGCAALSRPTILTLLVLLLQAFAPGAAWAAAVSGYWEYFIPGDEAEIRDVLADLDAESSGDLGISIIGISAWTDDTLVYYDHWENGYSFDPADPGSGADEVVLLRASSGGDTCSEDADGTKTPDCQTPESYHVFDSDDIPRNGWNSGSGNGCAGAEIAGQEYCYDGRDRIFVAGGNVTLSRATWSTKEGSLQALAWEVYPVRPQLTTYLLPFGEDLGLAPQNLPDFDRAFAMIQATEDGTQVRVDFNKDGVFDPVDVNRDGDCNDPGEGNPVILDIGETMLLSRDSDGNDGAGCTSEAALGTDGNLNMGTKIVGSETLQAHYIVGDEGSTYEIRGLSAFPRGLWSKEYYAPVGSHGDSTDVFLHNPHSSPLVISYATEAGTGTITVPAESTASFEAETTNYLPTTSGAYFSADEVFWGVSTIDTGGQIFDWGYALVPSAILRNEHRLSWAPAYTPGVASCNTEGETDNSGLFVTPAQANTTLYVDDDGDGTPDQTFALSLFDSLYIADSTFGSATERDLSNVHMWATGPYAAAWGQNPSKSGSGDPCALDMGYTILPSTDLGAVVLGADKDSNPPLLGLASGATTEFTLTMQTGPYGVQGLVVEDPLPANFSYVDDSAVITFPDGSTLSGNAADPVVGGQLLTWALETYGVGAGSMEARGVLTVTFQATNDIARGEGDCVFNELDACAIRDVNGVTQTFCAEDFESVCFSDYEVDIVKDTLTADPVSPGDTIDYQVVVSNPDATDTLTGVTLYDPLPAGTTYVAGSGQVTGPVSIAYADGFGSDLNNQSDNTGGVTWASDWIRNSTTDVFIESNGGDQRLRVRDNGRQVGRRADLSGYSQALLSFDARRGPNYNSGSIDVQVCQTSTSTSACSSGWVTVHSFLFGNDSGYVPYSFDLNGASFLNGNANSSSFALRIVTSTISMSNDDGVWLDNVRIHLGSTTSTNPSNDPPNFVQASDGYSLAPGETMTLTYSVTVDDPLVAGIERIRNVAYTNSAEIPLQISDDATNLVVVPSAETATVGDRVWIDDNANGVVDVGEAGIDGVTVALKDKWGFTVATTTTDSLGYYHFDGVPLDDDYYVKVVSGLPAGLVQVLVTGADDKTPTFDLRTTAILGGGTNRDEFSAAAFDHSDGGRAWGGDWIESNDDGNAAAGNILMSGGRLRIGDNGVGSQSIVQRALDVPGSVSEAILTFNYRAEDVEPGDTIYVEINTGSGWTTLETLPGALSDTAEINLGALAAGTGNQIRFRTGGGSSYGDADDAFYIDNLEIAYYAASPARSDLSAYLDADLGYQPASGTAVIGDRVWSDADGDGVQDAGEPGMSGVTVSLYTDTNGNGVIDGGEAATAQTTVTGPDGSYLFNVSADGSTDYIVVVDGAQTALGSYDLTTQSTFVFPDVADGASHWTADVGVVQQSAGTTYGIQDRLWFDSNGDGDQDGGESGISGVTVDLLDASGNAIATAATDANGDFAFTGVPEGVRYSWRVTDQGGVLADFYPTTAPATAGLFQMPNTLDEADDVADGSNDDVLDYSNPAAPAGYRPHFGYNLTRTIGDRVFNDLDGDGSDENGGDPGISGVTVELWRDVDGDGVFEPGGDDGASIASQVTDSNGNYWFSGLTADATYFVNIDNTQAALSGLATGTTPDDEAGPEHQREVTLNAAGDTCSGPSVGSSSAAACLAADFGYRAADPRAISGRIWEDANDDADDESGAEAGFENVTVELYQDSNGNGQIDAGEPRIGTERTDANGDYRFSGIQGSGSEDYIVRVTDEDGVLSGYDTTYEKTECASATCPASPNSPFNDLEAIVDLNGDVADLDFGYYKKIIPTLALIRKLKAYAYGGDVIVEWRVSSEIGTLGYYLERLDETTGEYVALHDDLLPGFIQTPQGGTYWLLDPDAQAKQRYSYRLVEVEIDGDRIEHGPFEIKVKNENQGSRIVGGWDAERIQDLWYDGFARERKEPSAQQIAKWQAKAEKRAAKQAKKPKKAFKSGKTMLRIAVTEDGLYRLGVSEIAGALGVNNNLIKRYLRKGKLALSNGGEEVAYFVADDNGALYFYGQGIDTVYTDTNVYWLGVGTPLYMETADAASDEPVPTNASFSGYVQREENFIAATYLSGEPDGEYWYWSYVDSGTPHRLDSLDAPGSVGGSVRVSAGAALLTIEARGGGENAPDRPDHHIEAWFNGVKIGEDRFDGTERSRLAFLFDQDSEGMPRVLPTGNRVEIRALLDAGVPSSFFWLDRIELNYRRDYRAETERLHLYPDSVDPVRVEGFASGDLVLLDLADPRRPRLLKANLEEEDGVYALRFAPPSADGAYLATTPDAAFAPAGLEAHWKTDLLKTNKRVDYLVIAPYALLEGAQALADLRQAEGLKSLAVDLQDVYNAFSHGVADAHAIRDFLDYTNRHWKRAPRFVVLAGKGTIDPRDHWGYGTNVLPILMADSPYGLVASDNRYADLVGDDGVPDVAIGRIPALSDEDLQAYVDKLVAYQGEGVSDWQNRAVMIADPSPDPAGDFPASSDSVIASLPGAMTVERRHYLVADADDAVLADFKAELKNAIDAGAGLVNFIGHGSILQIGKQAVLTADEVSALSNGGRLPVFATLTCAVGWDSYPGLDSLAGQLALHPLGGASAVFAPSGLSYNEPAVALNRAFVEAAYGQRGIRIGEAVQAALYELSAAGGPRFMIDMYGIFGDPAVIVPDGLH